MSELDLALLGPFQAAAHGQAVRFRSDKVRALLAYLALTPGQPHRRETLAALLWPDMPDTAAANNLRKTLHRLKESLGEEPAESILVIDRQTVQLNGDAVEVDANRMLELIGDCETHAHRHLHTCQVCLERLSRAAALYRGEVLAGFAVSDSLGFEEWLAIQREVVHQQALLALYNLAEAYTRRGEPVHARLYAARQLELGPWREEAHRQLMRALAALGRRSEALAQYETCRRVLADALGVEPAPETVALYDSLRSEEPTVLTPSSGLRGFPVAVTPFVGRAAEVAQIVDRLLDPDCRLLTVTGPGGIGKTRLCLHAAQDLAGRSLFPDGIVFVSVEMATTAPELQAALGQSLQLRFHEDSPPVAQLADYLRDKRLLVVLDGFDQLISDSGALAEWLAAAPCLKLLITSRERLNLRAEWLLPIDGLGFPIDDEAARPADHSSVQLFLELAARLRPGFAPTGADLDAIRRVCQAVGGLPLGIEIATGWLRHYTPTALADAVQHSLDFLKAPTRDMPARHQSLRAVFEHSWQLLSTDQRRVLAGLAILRGSFDAHAALASAGAGLEALDALIDKSLLQPAGDGRYRMHEQLRQFALEKPETGPGFDRHCQWFLSRVPQLELAFFGSEPQAAAAALTADFDNVRQAWTWAMAHDQADRLSQAVDGLAAFLLFAGLLGEAEHLFAPGEALIAQHPALASRLLVQRADFASRVGRLPEAQTLVECALALRPSDVFARITLGRILELQGRHGEALPVLEAVCADAQAVGPARLAALALNRLANVHWRTGAYPAAIERFQQALEIDRGLNHRAGQAMHLGNLGIVLRELGEYPRAEASLQQALEIDRELGNALGTARHLNNLGLVHWQTGRRDAALECYRQALAIAERLGHKRGIASCISNIGILHRERGEYAQAIQAYERALQLAREAGARANISNNLKNLGNTYRELGDYRQARRYYDEAQAMDTEDGNTEGLGRLWGYIGTLHAELNDLAVAREYFTRGVSMLRELGARYYLAWQLVDLAEVCLKLDDTNAARAYAEEGEEVSRAVGRNDYRVRARAIAARSLHAEGRTDAAFASLMSALPGADDVERAVLHEALWQIGADVSHATAALEAYQALTAQTPSAENRAHVEALRRASGH